MVDSAEILSTFRDRRFPKHLGNRLANESPLIASGRIAVSSETGHPLLRRGKGP